MRVMYKWLFYCPFCQKDIETFLAENVWFEILYHLHYEHGKQLNIREIERREIRQRRKKREITVVPAP